MSHGITSAAVQAGIGLRRYSTVGGYGGGTNDGQRRYILEVEDFLNLVGGLINSCRRSKIRIGMRSVRRVRRALGRDS